LNWNWQSLSGNTNLPWSLDLLKKYDEYWQWNVEYNWYTDTGTRGQEIDTNYLPSISTNPGIKWNVEMINFGRNKLDYWRLARRGNLSLNVIKLIQNELYRKEHTGWVFHKSSDFSHTEDIYLSGWENLAKNELIKLSPDIVKYLSEKEIELTYSVGNLARGDEGKYITSTIKLIELFKNSSFVTKSYICEILSQKELSIFFINNNFINKDIWTQLVVPYFTANKTELLAKFRVYTKNNI
jgi:hypothetical protein